MSPCSSSKESQLRHNDRRSKSQNDDAVSRIQHLLDEGKRLGHDLRDGSEEEEEEDADLVARAEQFFAANLFPLFICMLSGLLSLMYVPSIMLVLKTTGRSDDGLKSFSRYLSTLTHVVEWYRSPAARRASLAKVRRMHAKSSELCAGRTGRRMTQFDMVVTQFAFVGPAFIFAEDIGLGGATRAELEALAHQMYLVGRALGVRDDFNLCRGSLEEVRCYCRDIHRHVIRPGLERHDETNREMADHLLDGIRLVNPFVRRHAFRAWIFRLFRADNAPKMEAEVTAWSDRLAFLVQRLALDGLLSWAPTRPAFNYLGTRLMWLNIALTNRLEKQIISDNTKNEYKVSVCFWTGFALVVLAVAVLAYLFVANVVALLGGSSASLVPLGYMCNDEVVS